MTDHAREVRNLLTDARQLVSELGWHEGAKPNGSGLLIRCPSHPDRDPSCGITTGPDGTLRAKCHACDWSADAIGMIALAYSLDVKNGDEFRELLAIGARIGGNLLLESEILDGKPIRLSHQRTPVPAPPPIPERTYPDQAEVAELVSSCSTCESDPGAYEYLRTRGFDPSEIDQKRLAVTFSCSAATLPAWAIYKDVSWAASGHRLLVRVWDSAGKLRSIRSWQIDGLDGPKRLPPSGHKAAGLVMANAQGVRMLRGQAKAGRVLICEGEPDWLTWSVKSPDDVAVFGIGSGSWTPEHAAKIPNGSEVIILTHCDEAGEKYAVNVASTIGDRSPIWRLTGKPGLDENDKLRTGSLSSDPISSCEPMNDAAKQAVAERPRVLTVRQILVDSQRRAFSDEKPKVLTTGHWKIDALTGGVRLVQSWVVGADTSWGKSTWGISVADENLQAGARVLIVSTEDDESVYGDRLMARRSGVNAMRIRDRALKNGDHRRIADVAAHAEAMPVYLDGRGIQWERLLRQMVRVSEDNGINLVMLDYVQEIVTKQKYGDDRLMFKAIGQQFRHAFKTRGIASIMFSQLTIADPTKPPTKRDIRECKDLASGAEVVALGWSPQNDVWAENDQGIKEKLYTAGEKVLIIDKAKSGRKGVATLDWDDETASFRRVLRPYGEDGYGIPGFERADMDDIDAAIGGV